MIQFLPLLAAAVPVLIGRIICQPAPPAPRIPYPPRTPLPPRPVDIPIKTLR